MRVYLFEEGNAEQKMLLGGKGAGLAEMTRIGLPVPPGIIITTDVCKEYLANKGRFSKDLEKEIFNKLKIVEKKTGKAFGDRKNPLLVSVRSGAPVSMPGMMDTILNLGLNDETVTGFIKQTGDERFGYDCYRRLIQMFGNVVLHIGHDKFEKILESHKEKRKVKLDVDLDAEELKKIVADYKTLVKRETGRDFPQDPDEQLRLAIRAVFDSWNTKRAVEYRRFYKIPDDLCTAVNVQTMVFGNMGQNSGTGVAFTRNPSTGEKKLFAEYLMNAQGEDVVAGIRTPKQIDRMKEEDPTIFNELKRVAELLEKHYRDIQDIEFTIENGKLYILQTRTGKRTAQAAVKIAVDMVKEKLITKEEALLRVAPEQIDQLLHRRIDPSVKIVAVAKGLPASPGAASGIVIFDVDEAHKRGTEGEKIILVRSETTPEDIHGMVAAQGVLTSRGGMTCHAAIVARGMGKPCIVGCEEIKIDLEQGKFTAKGIDVKKGDVITIDGMTGLVILGRVQVIDPEMSNELKEVLSWADAIRILKVRANTDTPDGAKKARMFGAQGIGLCRTERMFNDQDRLPIVQEMILSDTLEERKGALDRLMPMQKSDFREIFKVMEGLPVRIRLLDLPLHEFLPRFEDIFREVTEMRAKGIDSPELKQKERMLRKINLINEHNPMLGHRGCRLGVTFPEMYEMQTRAILEAATELVKKGISVEPEIMLPLIGEANEMRFLRDLIEKTALQVMKSTGATIECPIGTMIEVPRAALTADEIAEYADFFSFGTNDLTQMTFAYSRDDAEAKFLAKYLENKILKANPFEILDRKGVGKLMQLCVQLGKKKNPKLEIGICGEHGGEPNSVEFCHEIGLNSVSCSPYRVPIARLAAAQAKIKEKKKIELD
jgi:pyruvate, orthophosphate dikinase